jgi:hypothetical protein
MAMAPGLRISDADREAAAAAMREHYALGRLTLEEFQRRLDSVFAAKTDIDLGLITRDLPHVSVPSASPVPGAFGYPAGNVRPPPFDPLATGRSYPGPGYHGPGYSGRGQSRRGTMAGTILLLLALVLLVTSLWPLSLFGWLVPRPLLIVVAIVLFARRMFRRLLGAGTMRPRRRR